MAQVLLGALNVWLGEHAWLVVAHLTVGALLWMTLCCFTTAGARRPPARRGPRARQRRAEARVQAPLAAGRG